MYYYHAIAVLSGNRTKTLPNRSEETVFSDVVVPFVAKGIITAKWGSKTHSYQVLELRIYRTVQAWDKRTGPLDDLIKGKRNLYSGFEARAHKVLGKNKLRVFVVMPIQGEEHGNQEEQRIHREYDERFETV